MNHDITPERLYKLLCGIYPADIAKELLDEIMEDRELAREVLEDAKDSE